jgi:flagellar biosynthesis protein FlhG
MGMDQAAGLRNLSEETVQGERADSVRVIAVTSGKGGVGKTSLSVNLAIMLRRLGKRVLLFDADLGLANVHVMLGLTPRRNLSHALRGDCRLEEILIEGPEGIHILPAASGIEEMAQLSAPQKMNLLEQIDRWSLPVDVMLIDTSAGLGDSVVHFNLSAQESIDVVTPEPTSITDAYALIKVLSQNHGQRRFHLIFNLVRSEAEAQGIFETLLKITDQFLDVSLNTLGHVTVDSHMTKAIRRQRALMEAFPGSDAGECLRRIARRLDRTPAGESDRRGGLGFFWRRMTLGAA